MADSVETWFQAVLLALHEVLLEAHPNLDRRRLWQGLEDEVLPQLQKQRSYVFFMLGCTPDKIDPKQVATALFLEAQRRERRNREPTVVFNVGADAEAHALPYLKDDTLIEDIWELSEEDVEFTE